MTLQPKLKMPLYHLAEDERQYSPSAARNLVPIQRALSPELPKEGRVLELASGTGEHIMAHAQTFPHLTWVPSDLDSKRLNSINAWCTQATVDNLEKARFLNACQPGWAKHHGTWDVILLVNLLHLITDAEMSVLLDEVTQALGPQGIFAVYGPFLRSGQFVSEADAAFHKALQSDSRDIGYKDINVLVSVLQALGFGVRTQTMPANNIMIFARLHGL